MDYHALLQNTLEAQKNGNTVTRGDKIFKLRDIDKTWLSFYDLLEISGESNSSQAFDFIQREFPEFAACFKYLKFPGRGKQTSWAFPNTHYSYLCDVFEILKETFPCGHKVPKHSSFKDQPSIPLEHTEHFFSIPEPPPLPPLPQQTIKPPKKAKTPEQEAVVPKSALALGPYGWYWLHKKIQPHPFEFTILIEMLKMKNRKFAHMHIAQVLNNEGHKNRQNRPWTTPEVTEALERYQEMLELWQAQSPDQLMALQELSA